MSSLQKFHRRTLVAGGGGLGLLVKLAMVSKPKVIG